MKVDLLRFQLESGKWVAFVVVACVAFAALLLGPQAKTTGGLVFTASPDESISNQCLLWSYRSVTKSVSMSADGSYIATVGGDGVQLFSRADNIPIWSYGLEDVQWVSMSADGFYIAAGSFYPLLGSSVYLFSRADNIPIWSYRVGEYVGRVSMSSDGLYIVAGEDDSVCLFSRADNTPIWSYRTSAYVSSVSMSADGLYIAAGSGDNKIYLFSRADNTPIWSYQTSEFVGSVLMSSDGSYIAAGGIGGVYLFSRVDNTPIWSYQTSSSFPSISISSDGSYIAAGGYGGILDGLYLFSGEPHVASVYVAIVAIVGCVALGIVIVLGWRRWGR